MEVSVFAPATVANLGLGFDVLGLALDGLGDTVTARLAGTPGVRIVEITGDGGKLSREARENTAGIAAISTLERAGVGIGVELAVHKGLPVGSGLGSSAASAAAAATAVNLLIGSPLRKIQLIEPCMDAEEAVSGRHADNVAPALLGGLLLVRETDPLDVLRLPLPEGLMVAVVTPACELHTKEAREALPREVPLSALVSAMANMGAFVTACHSGDLGLFARCMRDEVVGPARAPLIPGCDDVIAAALDAGALGASISGAGPSMFAFCRSAHDAAHIAEAMKAAFAEAGLESRALISAADCPGARRV